MQVTIELHGGTVIVEVYDREEMTVHEVRGLLVEAEKLLAMRRQG